MTGWRVLGLDKRGTRFGATAGLGERGWAKQPNRADGRVGGSG